MARFDPLTDYLLAYHDDSIILTFDEVEAVTGARLPRTARKSGSSFWANNPRNVYAKHWLAAGFITSFDECDDQEIRFNRQSAEPTAPAAPRPGAVVFEPDEPPPVHDPLGPPPGAAPPPPPPPPPPHAAGAAGEPDPAAPLPPPPAASSPPAGEALPPPPSIADLPPPPARPPEELAREHAGVVVRLVSDAFTTETVRLVNRSTSQPPGWAHLPDVALADRLQEAGTDLVWVRLIQTFGAQMDRGRGRPELWDALGELFTTAPNAFDPGTVVGWSLTQLTDALAECGAAQRLVEVARWRLLAETLAEPAAIPAVHAAVFDGTGDAAQLVDEATAPDRSAAGPIFSSEGTARRWVRMLAHPGGATISGLGELAVVVDPDVRRATELLGVTATGGQPIESARAAIEAIWQEASADQPPAGPGPIVGTALALDQALAFHGRVGCRHCRDHTVIEPIGPACDHCILKAATR